ncbi:GTP-binding protein [Psychromonas antarctica]|uniref:GTP-binding protein n=1 Tax=Psychromonas antarctica TaxID=67573 RepID=UPI001EE8108F|nr:GTP-binding protein [Psychromonas antarctica]MCG6200042.1 cobalamin biosynthesis protein [Psychromonas antarctica]
MKQKITCHIIGGFLGAGKSTLIQQLLTYKPVNEKWAVLVNESGNVHYAKADCLIDNIFIKEVYGGCLCCSAGLPFRVALNRLIKEVNPQRIFIEPSGAGHLVNIQKLLQGQFYLPVLDLKATICLLSEQQLSNTTYLQNEGYLALIRQADKLCLYDGKDNTRAEKIAHKYAKPLYILQQNKHDLRF